MEYSRIRDKIKKTTQPPHQKPKFFVHLYLSPIPKKSQRKLTSKRIEAEQRFGKQLQYSSRHHFQAPLQVLHLRTTHHCESICAEKWDGMENHAFLVSLCYYSSWWWLASWLSHQANATFKASKGAFNKNHKRPKHNTLMDGNEWWRIASTVSFASSFPNWVQNLLSSLYASRERKV